MMSETHTNSRHPFVAFIYLILLALVGTLVFSVIGLLFATAFYGLDELLKLSSGGVNIGFLKILQIFSSIGTFLVPAWMFSRSESKNPLAYLKLNTHFYPLLAIMTVVIMFSSSALLEWLQSINQQMHLPAFLQHLENWMRKQEDELAELTKQLLLMKSPGDLSLNIFMIALLPALGEELLFRGCMQPVFSRWTKNAHAGIWITAILFSAIHLQFYGFIPRMLLGALFGYLLLWSNNLWLPILGHFINNAVAVLTAYVFQLQGKPLDALEKTEKAPNGVYLISLFFTLVSVWIFYRYAQIKKLKNTSPNG